MRELIPRANQRCRPRGAEDKVNFIMKKTGKASEPMKPHFSRIGVPAAELVGTLVKSRFSEAIAAVFPRSLEGLGQDVHFRHTRQLDPFFRGRRDVHVEEAVDKAQDTGCRGGT